jgi:FkbM family methyltransferase
MACVFNYRRDFEKSLREFYINDQELIRRTHHKYLTSESIVIEVGGHNGVDASAMIEMYHPHKYVILEPMKLLFRKSKERLERYHNVILYNFGLGALNGIFHVNIAGNEGARTSLFKRSSLKGTCSLEVVNATSFFLLLGVGCFEVDLLTINCEGCEFEVLETILTSNLINYFRHIQYATHSTLESVADPVERYCKIQEKLARTHRLAYQFRFVWETWQRKDIIHN